MLFVGYFMQDIKDKHLFGQVINLHKLTGLTILVLMIIRMFWALTNPKPVLPAQTAVWERIAERSLHFMFYVVLIAMPIAGWVMSVAAGHTPNLFSWQIALPIAQNKETAEFFSTVHNTLAVVIIVFVTIHVLAALYHYFFRKDNVLQRMMPGSD